MSIKNTDRFVDEKIMYPLQRSDYPPEALAYKGTTLTLLGPSNKVDMMPKDKVADPILFREVEIGGQINQYIYTAQNGYLFQVALFVDVGGNIFIYGIRTMQVPDKKAKPKVKKEEEI